MLDAIPTSEKAKESSQDSNMMEGSSALRTAGSAEVEGGSSEQMAGKNLPQIQESLGTAEEENRRSSSPSLYSFVTVENPSISSKADSQSPIRQENRLPSSSSTRRQSLDVGSRAASAQNLKRSTSLWAQQRQRQSALDDAAAGEFQDRYIRNFGTGTMSERQRTLNVKRAKKMAQVFGQDPPTELIQIHDERESDHFRDSTATLSTFMTITPPLRDRANSVSSTGTIANEVEMDEEEVPQTPPPFSTTHDDATPRAVLRRRTAKLSRFFGVGFQDISLSAETAPPVPQTRIDVDVKVSGRRFWSFSDRSKDGDMAEAIQKLRQMKAG
ncbi:hypothetical protein B0H17DRAFT_263881 [Mycena rosella]|uniref:Uncharacterized protein n=1 Tax=Mycena rosella TaxID=1033263 RepID=A0AAD7G4D9_MYCRO|nr:hypothetical protein B0H17DRAFT_263881 [Mycena rosella]